MGIITTGLRYLPNAILGMLAGVVGAIVTSLAMVAGRYWLGIMPPPESVPDRVAPTLDIDRFFSMFGTYGGYNGLKQFGVVSGLRGLLTAGIVVGILYALVVESPRSRRSSAWYLGIPRTAWAFIGAAVLVVWLGFVALLWPVLPANYIGIPHSTARWVSVAALLVWFALFAATVMLVYRLSTRRAARVGEESPTEGDAPVQAIASPVSRRGIIAAAAGAALVWPTYELLQRLYNRATFFYDGRPYSGEDIQPITPTDRFYTVTKNVVDPDVNRDLWRLEIGGEVNREMTISFDDLQNYEQIDQESTLMCISNRIGAGLFSNAAWRGVRLRDVLNATGVSVDAYEIKLWGADAYTDTFGIDYALDENTLLVYEMNGEPLPRTHGYPVRVVVPGLFGEKNIKWVSRIEVVNEDAKGFYEQQGWGPSFVPPTRSDIFRPRTMGAGESATFRSSLPVGQPVDLRGRAFAADRGVDSVEVTTDGGETWKAAEIYYPGTDLTWALWRFQWTPVSPGEYRIYSRAVDGTGEPQPSESRGIVPQGAQGYNIVTATVE
jgi:DMSO/TMAO reductase YedYZ molybdopterin-dependent catalytic subunit